MRMYLKNRKIRKKRSRKFKVFIIIIIFFFIMYLFSSLTSSVSSFYMDYAKSKVLEMINIKINDSIKQETFKELSSDDLFYVTKNSNNEIEMIDYNTYKVNMFLDVVSSSVSKEVLNFNDEVVLKIPFFSVLNNPIFSNVGPSIPVKVRVSNAIYSNVEVKIKEYGINNCLVEIYILLEVNVKVLLPIISDDIVIKNEIPISYKIINGQIPSYYGGNLSKNSNIYALPLE